MIRIMLEFQRSTHGATYLPYLWSFLAVLWTMRQCANGPILTSNPGGSTRILVLVVSVIDKEQKRRPKAKDRKAKSFCTAARPPRHMKWPAPVML